MDYNQCVAALAVPLPEDILKRKWAGDFQGAIKAIETRLLTPMPPILKQRLQAERERLLRMPTQYPWNRQEALA